MAGWLLKLKKWYTRKRITTVVHLLLSPTQGLCSKPRHQSRGQHVLLWWCGSSGPSPARGTTRKRLQHSPFSVGPGSWNHKIPDHEMAAALLLLRRLFLSIGGKWGVDGKPMTSVIDSDGRPLIERPTTSSKWPPPWSVWICVEIWTRQGELSKSHRLDRSYSSKWSKL